MEKIIFDYYYGNQAEQYSFYRIPKILFKDKTFKSLSTDAKVLYGLMLDRMGLSVKNRWFDDENKVYIIYTLKNIMENFGCADNKATKLLKELDKETGIGLIERKRQGLGKPDIIYVKSFVITPEVQHESGIVKITTQEPSETQVQNSENHDSGTVEITSQGSLKSRAINTNINNTEYNNTDNNKTDYINHQSYLSCNTASEKFSMDRIEDYEKYRELVKRNIEYEGLILHEEKEVIDNIVDIMADVLTFPAESYYINHVQYPAPVVKSAFMKINYTHISNMLLAMNENCTKIRNVRSYLIAAIFNSYSTLDVYIDQRVHYDMQKMRE